MSKADTLGTAPAFGAARTARSSRRDAIDRTIGGGEGAAAASVTELPVTLISENPDNPRNHLRNLDEIEQTVREVGVLLPIVVATAEAYLRADRADRAADIDEGATYVVVDGHRRLEAARRVGLATIPVRVDNARVSTDEALLEAAFIANYHRDDMTDLEEAHALEQLVEYYGSQTKAAKRLGIAQGTISSKLSLLKLTPELQKDLMTGARTVEHVRNLGKLAPEEQVEKANARAQAARQQAVQSPPGPTPAPMAGAADYHGVIIPEEASPEAPPGAIPDPKPEVVTPEGGQDPVRVDPPGKRPAEGRSSQTVPEPRTDTGAPPTLRYDDGAFLGMHLPLKMENEPFFLMLGLLLEKAHEKDPDELRRILAERTAAAE